MVSKRTNFKLSIAPELRAATVGQKNIIIYARDRSWTIYYSALVSIPFEYLYGFSSFDM